MFFFSQNESCIFYVKASSGLDAQLLHHHPSRCRTSAAVQPSRLLNNMFTWVRYRHWVGNYPLWATRERFCLQSSPHEIYNFSLISFLLKKKIYL